MTKLDEGLFRVMQSGERREALREALLQSCFSVAAALLREQSVVNLENYDIITSRHIAAHTNAPGFLLTLSGRGIIPPSDCDLSPSFFKSFFFGKLNLAVA